MSTDPVPEVIAIEVTAKTNKVGSVVTDVLEFDLEDWNSMDEHDRETLLMEHLLGSGMIDWDWKELP
jgi:hypothetical protein